MNKRMNVTELGFSQRTEQLARADPTCIVVWWDDGSG